MEFKSLKKSDIVNRIKKSKIIEVKPILRKVTAIKHLASQYLKLNFTMKLNIMAFIASLLALMGVRIDDGITVQNHITLYLGIASVFALSQLLYPIWKDANKGEPNSLLGAYAISSLLWVLFAITYNEMWLVILNCLFSILVLGTLLFVRRNKNAFLWAIPTTLLIILSVLYHNDIQKLTQSYTTLAISMQILAPVYRIVPFLLKLWYQKIQKEFHPESIQGLTELALLLTGWLIWHITTQTYWAALLLIFTLIIVGINIYLDVRSTQSKTK